MSNTLTVPVTFVDGTDALAADVNSNFNAISTFLNSTKLNDDNIKAGGISSVSLASSAVATANIANQAVTAPCIANNSITQAQVAVRAVKTDGTNPGAGGMVFSPSSGSWTGSSSAWVTPTNLSITLTTTGRPVRVALESDGSANVALVGNLYSAGAIADVDFRAQFIRGATSLGILGAETQGASATVMRLSLPPSSFAITDIPVAGTYTYAFQLQADTSSYLLIAQYCRLVAYEVL